MKKSIATGHLQETRIDVSLYGFQQETDVDGNRGVRKRGGNYRFFALFFPVRFILAIKMKKLFKYCLRALEISTNENALNSPTEPEQVPRYAANSSLRDRHFRDYKLGFESRQGAEYMKTKNVCTQFVIILL